MDANFVVFVDDYLEDLTINCRTGAAIGVMIPASHNNEPDN